MTIYALATPAGRSAIAIVRITGPAVKDILAQIAPKTKLVSHTTRLSSLYHNNRLLDTALVLFFQGPRSYTGQDMAELHVHGSRAVVQSVLGALRDLKARSAEPGEFTKRAFQNGKMDLTQVEGLRDLLEAETELQRQAAVAANGIWAQKFKLWRSIILEARVSITAFVDFSEDNQLEGESQAIRGVTENLGTLLNDVRQHLASAKSAELVQSGIKIALLGPPNVGKSSLTNLLVQRSVCIVSDVPGTTRDAVQVALDISGYKILLSDTAGVRKLRSTSNHDKLEALGMAKTVELAEEADIVLVVESVSEPQTNELAEHVKRLKSMGKQIIHVCNKSDLFTNSGLSISCKTGSGIKDLHDAVADACSKVTASEVPLISASQRTRELIEDSLVPGLEACLERLEAGDVVAANFELEAALNAIGSITGETVSVNEVLGAVFGSFCIGK